MIHSFAAFANVMCNIASGSISIIYDTVGSVRGGSGGPVGSTDFVARKSNVILLLFSGGVFVRYTVFWCQRRGIHKHSKVNI